MCDILGHDDLRTMKSKYIDVDGHWGVLVCYNYNTLDFDEIWALCKTFGMSDKSINKALRILSSYNTGMAVSSDEYRMSTMFVSHATSPSEWWSSAIHELKHISDAIVAHYCVEWDGEDAAYLTGYLTKRLVEEIAIPCG